MPYIWKPRKILAPGFQFQTIFLHSHSIFLLVSWKVTFDTFGTNRIPYKSTLKSSRVKDRPLSWKTLLDEGTGLLGYMQTLGSWRRAEAVMPSFKKKSLLLQICRGCYYDLAHVESTPLKSVSCGRESRREEIAASQTWFSTVAY